MENTKAVENDDLEDTKAVEKNILEDTKAVEKEENEERDNKLNGKAEKRVVIHQQLSMENDMDVEF